VTHHCATAYTETLHHVKLKILKHEKQAKSKSRSPHLCWFSVMLVHQSLLFSWHGSMLEGFITLVVMLQKKQLHPSLLEAGVHQ
jgi:hypothetical protein